MSSKPKSHLGENISAERWNEIFGRKEAPEDTKEARDAQEEQKASNDGGE